MATSPGHPVLLRAIHGLADTIERNRYPDRVVAMAGPDVLTYSLLEVLKRDGFHLDYGPLCPHRNFKNNDVQYYLCRSPPGCPVVLGGARPLPVASCSHEGTPFVVVLLWGGPFVCRPWITGGPATPRSMHAWWRALGGVFARPPSRRPLGSFVLWVGSSVFSVCGPPFGAASSGPSPLFSLYGSARLPLPPPAGVLFAGALWVGFPLPSSKRQNRK